MDKWAVSEGAGRLAALNNRVPVGFAEFRSNVLFDTMVVNRQYAMIDSLDLTNNRETR